MSYFSVFVFHIKRHTYKHSCNDYKRLKTCLTVDQNNSGVPFTYCLPRISLTSRVNTAKIQHCSISKVAFDLFTDILAAVGLL